MEWIKDYLMRAFDFSGEEIWEDYKKACLLTFGCHIVISILSKIGNIIENAPFIINWASKPVAMAVLCLFIGCMFAFTAATVRRCGCLGRSKAWFLLGFCLLPGPLILMLVLRDRQE